jgi:bifunctional ADP-heptose synthase (sugar kinase/adenylyltransferase)
MLKEIANRRVLVIGDTIVDSRTDVERVKDTDDRSPVYRKLKTTLSVGGAALVVRNLVELGAQVEFLTGIGWGPSAQQAEAKLRGHKNLVTHFVMLKKMQTVKGRYFVGWEKVFQVDQVDDAAIDEDNELRVIELFDLLTGRTNTARKPAEVVIVADYRHGFINRKMAEHFAERYPGDPPLLVSSQVAQSDTNHRWYHGAPVYVLNANEADALMVRDPMEQDSDYVQSLRESLDCSTVIVTLGKDGCLSADDLVGGQRTLGVEGLPVVDALGAGDAFLAAYAVTGMLSFANTWAGLACCVAGPNPPTKEMLREHATRIEGHVLGENRDGAQGAGGHEAHKHERGFSQFT